MYYFFPRSLKVLSLAILISFLASAFALGGLVGGVVGVIDEQVDAVEEPLDVSGEDTDDQLVEEPQVDGESADLSEEPIVEVVDSTVDDAPVVEVVDSTVEEAPVVEVVDDLPDSTAEVIEVQVDDDVANLNGEDKYVRVDNALLEYFARNVGLGQVGYMAYWLQEDVAHGSITKLSGQEIDHYYAWVCVGSECIPVDPFRVSN